MSGGFLIPDTRLPWEQAMPILDGYALPASMQEALAQGTQKDVPVLTGASLGELSGVMIPPAHVTAESYAKPARMRYDGMADEFPQLYPAATDEEA
jgi:hypothetical protein